MEIQQLAAGTSLDAEQLVHGGLANTDRAPWISELCGLPVTRHPLDIPPAVFAAYTDLIESGMWEGTARKLVREICWSAEHLEQLDAEGVRRHLITMLIDRIKVGPPLRCVPGQCRVAAFVGPRGAGKTTTVAKLAANLRLREKRQLGFIAVHADTSPAVEPLHDAVEPLQDYADAIDIPLHRVSGSEAMNAAIRQFGNKELILVDTYGVDPNDVNGLRRLAGLLNEAGVDGMHVVFNSNDSLERITACSARFGELGATAVIPTCLDRISESGRLFEVFRQVQLPISYFADGSNVAQDIHAADAQLLATRVIGTEQVN